MKDVPPLQAHAGRSRSGTGAWRGGCHSELRSLGGNSEFLFVGSGVSGDAGTAAFTSAGDAQELYCHMDSGYEPKEFVFGNIAYSVGAVGGFTGTLKTLVRGEIKEFSDVFNETRHHALDRLVAMRRLGRQCRRRRADQRAAFRRIS